MTQHFRFVLSYHLNLLYILLFNTCCQNKLISVSKSEPEHIVFVDKSSSTVCCIEESGELIKRFDLVNLEEPSDIAINGNDYFICDYQVIIIEIKALYVSYNIDSEYQFC